MSKRLKNIRRGFTLIELLVVIAIIGILASVVLASLSTARAKSRYARVLSDLEQIKIAAEMDLNDRGSYASDGAWCTAPAFVPKYISIWPKPPCPGWGYDWDNWDNGDTVRITLRGGTCGDGGTGGSLYYYCIYSTGNCHSDDGTDFKSLASKEIQCQ